MLFINKKKEDIDMKKNYIEEAILVSVFTIISMYIYQEYRATYFSSEPSFSIELLIFPLIIIVTFVIVFFNKKQN